MPNVTAVGGEAPTNGAKAAVAAEMPYTVIVGVEGTTDLLSHRWNVEGVAEKAKAAKGSAAKKSDDIESYVYRTDAGQLAIPGEYLRQAVIHAAKYKQDPRSPRKSAMDLVKAGVVSLTPLAPLGKGTWDYEDRRRVVIQRSAITRVRPAIKAGWRAGFDFLVSLPEYIDPALLNDLVGMAGRLIGIADFRPTYGRFQIVRFEVLAGS